MESETQQAFDARRRSAVQSAVVAFAYRRLGLALSDYAGPCDLTAPQREFASLADQAGRRCQADAQWCGRAISLHEDIAAVGAPATAIPHAAQSYPGSLLRAATLARRRGDFPEAIRSGRRACGAFPAFGEAYRVLGDALWRSKQFASSVSAYHAALLLPERTAYPAAGTPREAVLVLSHYHGHGIYAGPDGFHAARHTHPRLRRLLHAALGTALFRVAAKLRTLIVRKAPAAEPRRVTSFAHDEALASLLRTLRPKRRMEE